MPSYVLSNSIDMSLAVKFEEVLASVLLHMLADKCWHEMCSYSEQSIVKQLYDCFFFFLKQSSCMIVLVESET